jgi:2-haloacid dehalogenase
MDALGLADRPDLRARLMDLYRNLSPFPEVPDVLRRLREAGFATAILSNGSPDMLASAVASGGLAESLDAVLSVDAVRTFKPDPRAYQLAVGHLSVPAEYIAFMSSNAWDAHAAAAFGMQVVWCSRYGQPPERLPGKPAHEIRSLSELPPLLLR